MNQVTFHDQDLWKKIYDLALAYGKREAWNYYWDNDIFEVPLTDGRASHCSIFGKAGELFGLCVYVGDSGLDSLKRMHYHHLAGISPESAWKCQECIGLFWGDRDEVAEEQYSIIKQLGLKFRGRGKWIYTEVYHKNYAPACPSDEEAVILKETLEKLLPMLDLATPDWNKPNQYHSDLASLYFPVDGEPDETVKIEGQIKTPIYNGWCFTQVGSYYSLVNIDPLRSLIRKSELLSEDKKQNLYRLIDKLKSK